MKEKMYNMEAIKVMVNGVYGSGVIDTCMEILRSGDPLEPKRSIKAHSFIKKKFIIY